MKVIIPLAGKGTRLRPHTHITPKPMLKIAGKPVIDYVMEDSSGSATSSRSSTSPAI